MLFIVMRSLLALGAAVGLAAVLCSPTNAAPTKPSKIDPSILTFKVDRRTFLGTAKTVCVIEGKWADGELFRYEAWDKCADMSMRRATKAEFKDAPSLGNNDDYEVTDIPDGSEVIQINNDYSSVLLFRDGKGVMRTILVGD